MKQILISTLGLSPGVVTGAYYTLVREGYTIGKVYTVTAASVATRQCEQLIWETLTNSEGHPDYEPRRAIEQAELGDSRMTERFSRYVEELLEACGEQSEIFLVLTGGRTSMAAATMLAVQRYTFNHQQHTERLRLYHVEVTDAKVEEYGTVSRLTPMTSEERAYYLDPPVGALSLVQIPLLPMVREPNRLWKRLFKYVVGAYLLEAEEYEQLRFGFAPAYLRDQDELGEVDVYAEKRIANPAEPIETVDRVLLRTQLAKAFDLSELEILCFDLSINADEFGHLGRTELATALIQAMERYGRLLDLIELCQQRRPMYSWNEAIQLRQALLCSCKLYPEANAADSAIVAEEVDRLAGQVKAVSTATQRPVVGWLITNTADVKRDAAELAAAEGIVIYQATLPPQWRERADWKIEGQLRPLVEAE